MRRFFTLLLLISAGIVYAQDSAGFICDYPGEGVPEFPGGDSALQKYLKDNTRYPSKEKALGKEGRVYVGFAIAADGKVCDVYVRKGVPGAPGLDAEALRVVSNMPDWIPATLNGKGVKVLMTIPIRFELSEPSIPVTGSAATDTTIYDVADVMPEFPGGPDSMAKFLAANIKYPVAAKENGLEGTVYITYTIEKDGSVSGVRAVSDPTVSVYLAKEAVRVVGLFPKHSTGMKDGKPVRVQVITPVRFTLR